MDSPEKPAFTGQGTSRSTQQPLYIRMYFRQHMSDVVRAFAYEELSKEEAQRRLDPLIATHGKPNIAAACGEIGLWRLTDHARRLAASLIGHPQPTPVVSQSASPPTDTEPPVTPTEPQRDAAASKKRSSQKPRKTKKRES